MRHTLNQFNFIAPLYDRVAQLVFGQAISVAQLRLIQYLPPSPVVCIVGGGSGEFLSALLQVHPTAQVIYIESSSAMIQLSQAKLTKNQAAQVTWIHATHEALMSTDELNTLELSHVNVMCTFFFLDVLTPSEAKDWIVKISDQLPSHACWLFADFIPSSKLWQRLFVRLMYICFYIVSGLKNQQLADYNQYLTDAGWLPAHRQTRCRGMITSTVYRRDS